uniref:Glutaredoxin-2, mitochondrial n=1 Tax=Ruditapes philippinarum TaxID=129788 RepID=C8CBL8_RUDPH|nr:glutaredoxin B [Ruditapes philippinarum]
MRSKLKLVAKKVVIYSKPGCPYCTMAKGIFTKFYLGKGDLDDEDYEVIELTKLPNGSQVQAELAKMTHARTVPRVFINGKCVGGGSETEQLHKTKQLGQMLKSK